VPVDSPDLAAADTDVGVTITRKIDCVMARAGTDVEVWRPASVSRTYGVPGEPECSPSAATLRREQLPPH
jgi:hypothetical protein